MPYGFRYPHEKGSIVFSGCLESSLALKIAPSHTPWCSAPVNAVMVFPRLSVRKGEYPLVLTSGVPPELKRLSLSTMS